MGFQNHRRIRSKRTHQVTVKKKSVTLCREEIGSRNAADTSCISKYGVFISSLHHVRSGIRCCTDTLHFKYDTSVLFTVIMLKI